MLFFNALIKKKNPCTQATTSHKELMRRQQPRHSKSGRKKGKEEDEKEIPILDLKGQVSKVAPPARVLS